MGGTLCTQAENPPVSTVKTPRRTAYVIATFSLGEQVLPDAHIAYFNKSSVDTTSRAKLGET